MFVRIPYKKLAVGKKYKIVGECDNYTGIYQGFEQGPYFNLKFSNVKGKRVLFSTYDNFCEFLSKNPQGQMERRAVNLILRRLIGDDCFEW